MRCLGYVLIVFGTLLMAYEGLIAMGENHSLGKNWPWFVGVMLLGVILVAGGVYLARRTT